MGFTTQSKKSAKPINKDLISHCENSTITEAWAVVQGSPKILDNLAKNEVKALQYAFRSKIPHFKLEPSMVVVQNTKGPIAPFWSFQGSWNSKTSLLRAGHQFLSVHTLCEPPKLKYDRFESSFQPNLELALNVYKNVVVDSNVREVNSIIFGYINTFQFKEYGDGFDPTKYFNFMMGLDLGKLQKPLSQYKATFNLFDQPTDTHITVDLVAGKMTGTNSSFEITTQISAEKTNTKGLCFNQIKEILSSVRQVQKVAKQSFYHFATEVTLSEIMKAREYAK